MKIQLNNAPLMAARTVRVMTRYRVLIFIILVTAVYGYVLFTINSLTRQQPSSQSVNTELKTIKVPKIDQTVVKQLQQLRDNNVSVHTLFEQARDNPFNE